MSIVININVISIYHATKVCDAFSNRVLSSSSNEQPSEMPRGFILWVSEASMVYNTQRRTLYLTPGSNSNFSQPFRLSHSNIFKISKCYFKVWLQDSKLSINFFILPRPFVLTFLYPACTLPPACFNLSAFSSPPFYCRFVHILLFCPPTSPPASSGHFLVSWVL